MSTMCQLDRGSFIAGAASTLVTSALLLPPWRANASGLVKAPHSSRYVLWLQRMQTGEVAAEPFSVDGRSVYMPGYERLCGVLRDLHVPLREGDVQMSMRTIEALWSVQQYLSRAGISEPIVVHSGYRTPRTNANTEGAARQSYHMWAMAVDFHVPNVAMDYLAAICMACPTRGGVGYYPGGWVHLDTGPQRYWSG